MKFSPPATTANEEAGDITCQKSVQWVSLLRDGELSPPKQARLQAHITACPRCQVARQQFARLHDALDLLLGRPQPPSD
jgi:ferric-dicitrate binding protein FerR (iron transport regulator)